MQIVKWTAEGAVKGRKEEALNCKIVIRGKERGPKAEYSATWGIRQLPGIWRYSAKRTGHAVNQGGTAGEV